MTNTERSLEHRAMASQDDDFTQTGIALSHIRHFQVATVGFVDTVGNAAGGFLQYGAVQIAIVGASDANVLQEQVPVVKAEDDILSAELAAVTTFLDRGRDPFSVLLGGQLFPVD